MSGRPATPPILYDPSENDDVEYSLDWYYGKHAGGYVLPFGKHAGQKIHHTSITYLYWCRRHLDKNQYAPTLRAIHAFHYGLQRHVETNCGDFRFPFGMYRGRKISECPDDYLLWANDQPQLTSKYGVFFKAVARWLERPLEEKVGPFEPSYRVFHSKEGGRSIVNALGLDERNTDSEGSPSKTNSQSRVVHVGLRISPEGKKSSDGGTQEEDSDSGQTASISESTIKAESGRERHYEIRCHVPRHSTRVFLLRITDSEESLPSSVTQQNERNPREPEKVQMRESQEKNVIGIGKPLGKWFQKASAKGPFEDNGTLINWPLLKVYANGQFQGGAIQIRTSSASNLANAILEEKA